MKRQTIQIDWEEYDNRTIRDNRDRSKFSCQEAWEVDYLVQALLKQLPEKDESAIRKAIMDCCEITDAPHFREEFVQRVLTQLR
jgi:hypothetical protein